MQTYKDIEFITPQLMATGRGDLSLNVIVGGKAF